MTQKSNIKTIRVSLSETVDGENQRGVTYTGIMDMPHLKEKLKGPYSLPLASAFPLYKSFIDPQQLNCVGHYYEPPSDIAIRKAATLNRSLGNLLMSNLPSWAAIPDRETSAMVFSSSATAEEHYPGQMYRAVPAGNAKLVIAPAPRLRYCFQNALGSFGITDSGLKPLTRLNGCFHDLFNACGMAGEFPRSWETFLTALNDVASEKLRPQRELVKDTGIVLDALIANKVQVLDFVDSAFSPANNGFKVIDYNDSINKEAYPDNEIWLAAPCLFIAEKLFENL